MHVSEYNKLTKKEKGGGKTSPTSKPQKKVQTGKELLSLSVDEQLEAFSCITINSKAIHAEYDKQIGEKHPTFHTEFQVRESGNKYRIHLEKIN